MAGDIATLAKARRELEDLYSGIPDDSVNLTFQDFAQVKQLPTTHPVASEHSVKSNMERKASGTLAISSNNIIVKSSSSSSSSSALTKLPSLDFNKAFEEASISHQHNRNNNNNLQHGHESTRNNSYYVGTNTDHQGSNIHGQKFNSSYMDHYGEEAALHTSRLGTSTDRPPSRAAGNYNVNYGHGNHAPHHHNPADHHNGHHQAITNTASGYHQHHHQHQAAGFMDLNSDHHHDIISNSGTSSMMMSNSFMDSFQGGSSIGGTRRRRPGIPHSNICSICSVYIYMFRNNRCLVCGRVYCRQCVSIGMGEMTEGRKCIQCLGKRFSQRYIDRAGKTGGCCMGFLDSSTTSRAKQREIEWAEKGPRKSGGGSNTNTNTNAAAAAATATPSRNYSNYSRSEVSPRTPTHGAHRAAPPPDFSRGSSPYSPYSTHSPASSYHFPL